MNIYCVYLTVYLGNKLPPFYIGSSNIQKVEKGYKGSVTSIKYRKIWENEIKENPNLFKTKIISNHKSRKEATEKENKLQNILGVVKSSLYVNMSVASPNGYFGMDVSGENNPNYNNKWTEEKRKISSETQKELRKTYPEKYYNLPPLFGKENPRWKDGKTTFRDNQGNTIFTSKNDPRVINKELIGVGTNVEKSNLTKSKNPNCKKYEYIKISAPEGKIVTLYWNEYGEYFKNNKIYSLKKLRKGYSLIEIKLNPNWKMNPPTKKPKILL